MPPGGAQGPTPDKRTTAYENIFGRPTAKPKGPVAQPMGPSAAQQQHWQQQAGYYAAQQQQQQARFSGGMGQPQQQAYPQYPAGGSGLGGIYQPSSVNYSQEQIDRRSSRTPSFSSQASGSSPYPHTPYNGSSAADSYQGHAGLGPSGQTPASAYAASFHSNGSHPALVALGPPARISPRGPAERQQSQPYPVDGYADGRPSMSSSHDLASSSAHNPYNRPGSLGGSPFGSSSNAPPLHPPRIPSIELPLGQTSPMEGNWFKGLSLGDSSGNADGSQKSSPERTIQPMSDGFGLKLGQLQQPHFDGEEDDNFATPGPRDGGDPFSTEFQTFQAESAQRAAELPQINATSAASSMYDGTSQRRSSVESDRRSIADTISSIPPGAASNGSANNGSNFYQTGYNGSSGSGLRYPGAGPGFAVAPLTSSAGTGSFDSRQRTPRSRTASSATHSGLPPSPSTARFEGRSMSIGSQQQPGQLIRSGVAGAPPSHHSSIASGHGTAVPPNRRGPLVYPALLSKVAEAFKMRVTIAERVKDGLTYQDAFDGREAVDRIAYIIKTTDRNLALLLGRALDAQKFFHDVTYDHRLRDSPNELYQFRTRLASPFGSEGAEEQFVDANETLRPGMLGAEDGPKRVTSHVSLARSTASSITGTETTSLAPAASIHGEETAEDEEALPTGVFTLLTDCYSPTCTRDRLCYSIACPRRLEQQARLNMKPQPVLKRSLSKESLGDTKAPGALWAETVSKEIFDSVSEQERKRQELLNEVIYTERDFVRDLEYLRDQWIKPLRTRDIIPEARRDEFITQVFWNVLEVHAVNAKLAEALTKRQKHQDVVEKISDIFLEVVPHFGPFVKYGAHQLYGKYEFEKEKASNPAFAKFVDETERLPESRKLELNGYLTKPTTRLARYPLLLDAVVKATADNNPDKLALPRVVKIVKEFLNKVNIETGKSENRFNLAQLDQQLVFKPGEAVDLRLRDEQRELVFKGPLKKRGGTQSESAELQVFLFDHALLMVKAKTVHKNELYKVYRKPIPLELLLVTVYDEVPTGKGTATRPKSIMSKTSTGSRLSGGVPTGSAPKQDAKTGYALTFTYLGRKGYSLTLWASTFVGRKKWFEHIESRQDVLRHRSNIFETMTLSENFFSGPTKVNCSVPFDFGRRIIYGAEDGVYLSDLREKARPPTKVLPLPYVTQIDVLEEYQILIILADRCVHTFTLDALDPTDPVGSLKRGRRISSHTSFFKAGQCLGRTLVCVVKSSSLSSTIKTLEPIEQNVRGKKQPTFRKLLQGGQETLRVFKEFYIPTESSSIHFLKSKLCVGCTKGFEIVDLETLDTQGLLDPADSSLDFVHRKETVKPIAIYRIDGEFLLCYDEFAFYVNKNGWRARGNWIVHWEGNPTSFAYHHPYVLAFEPSFIEVRHVETGALHQVITGFNLRCLFADVAPPQPRSGSGGSDAGSSASSIHSQPTMSNPYGRPAYPPMQRQLTGPPNYGPQAAAAYPGMPPPRPPPIGYGPQGQPIYPRPPPPQGGAPGMPPYGGGYAVAAPQPRPPQPQRNPVWESVAASRHQIVFMGDTTVFAVRLANPSKGSASGSISAPGTPALQP